MLGTSIAPNLQVRSIIFIIGAIVVEMSLPPATTRGHSSETLSENNTETLPEILMADIIFSVGSMTSHGSNCLRRVSRREANPFFPTGPRQYEVFATQSQNEKQFWAHERKTVQSCNVLDEPDTIIAEGYRR